MSVNGLVGSAAIALTLAGTIVGACKRTGAQGTPETSATPNSNSVRNNNAAEASRDLGARFAAC
jgi:hypothetical protein